MIEADIKIVEFWNEREGCVRTWLEAAVAHFEVLFQQVSARK